MEIIKHLLTLINLYKRVKHHNFSWQACYVAKLQCLLGQYKVTYIMLLVCF